MINILYLHAGAELYGADIILLQLIKNLDKNKFNVHVILPNNGELVSELKKNSIQVEIMNYPILRRKYFNLKGLAYYIYNYYIYSKRLKEYCIKSNINIIHVNTLAVLEGIYLRKKLHIKYIWHIHEIITKPKFLNKLLSLLVSKYSDTVVVVSEAVKRNLIDATRFNKNNIRVIYNGIDNNIFNNSNDVKYLKSEFSIEDDDVVVGMIGRVNAWKGQESFLEAINIVLEKNKNVKVFMVGGVFEGEEWRIAKLKEKIEQSKYKDRIIFEDYRKDTPNLHCLFDIFVLPSIQPDPLPTVVLEAMASGTPVVGYKHGGITEMVKEGYNGIFADVCNSKDLARRINELVDNKELREEFGMNSYKRQVAKFSLQSYISNFEKVYKF